MNIGMLVKGLTAAASRQREYAGRGSHEAADAYFWLDRAVDRIQRLEAENERLKESHSQVPF